MIHILPPEIANRIAAGEVVERPASVVRELIDNAVDAGATRIDVEVEEGGLRVIRVSDNGCGMSPEDAALSAKRHATSKIQTAEDLSAITTKGFRGEALAAISSIARFELITRRTEDEFGSRLVVEGGAEQPLETVGASAGTIVTVRDLFFNTPARRKFLKKNTTELGHILAVITWNALAHEAVHFTFSNNGRRTLDLPAVANRPERIQQLFGKDILANMIPIDWQTPVVSLSGLISRPTLSRNDANQVFFFVNDRYIKDRVLHRALMNGYRNLLPAGRFPTVFLYLEIDPAEIDINVHPTKQEIKFSREDAIFSAMYGAVRQVWDSRTEARQETEQIFQSLSTPTSSPKIPNLHPPISTDGLAAAKLAYQPTPNSSVLPLSSMQAVPIAASQSSVSKSEAINRNEPEKLLPIQTSISVPTEPRESAPSTAATHSITQLNRKPIEPTALSTVPSPPAKRMDAPGSGLDDLRIPEKSPDELFASHSLEEVKKLKIHGQLLNSYILAEDAEGLFIIDQHAAHERLMFEQFMKQAENAVLASQPLLFPLTMDLTPEETARMAGLMEILVPLGFDLEPFGARTFVIRSLPASLCLEEAEAFIKDLLSELHLEGNAQQKRDRALQTLACRAAVKFGDPLTQEEMETIVNGLAAIPRRNVCPHGRPNILYVSDASLRRLFKRTGFS